MSWSSPWPRLRLNVHGICETVSTPKGGGTDLSSSAVP